MNAHTYQVLEFDRVKEILSGMASSPLGAKRALDMIPYLSLEEIEEEMDRVTELDSVLGSGDFALGPVREIGDTLDKCSSEGSLLESKEIYEIAETAKTARLARTYFSKNETRCPHLSVLASGLEAFEELENAVFRSIDEEGEILDTASAELASARRARGRLKDKIRRELDKIIGSNEDLLQEKLITLRQERYVIPLKSEGKGRIECIVHDVSSSGATLFVEPLSVLGLNNELRENRRREEDEIRRILTELSEIIRHNMKPIRESLAILGHLDLLHAKVRFASQFRCTRPRVDESGRIELKKGVHPLLVKKKGLKEVEPLDLELGRGFNTLLVSGPNAGGKTVALKTVGVLALLSQCGMHIPAGHGSHFSVFAGIYADIGDEQSIERDLSTFSSHMGNIVDIMKSADRQSLVLLDEVGVGTDPRSGAGIAMAVLSELTRRGARTLATSHYGDLKIFVEAAEGMENASVEFNPETLQPTYRLKMGIPGSSNAFEIAHKLGMNQELLSLARRLTRESASRAEEIIASLERSLAKSDRLAEEAKSEGERFARLASEFETKLTRIRAEEKEAKKRRREQAKRILEKARATVENLVREIRESQAEKKAIGRAKKILAEELLKCAEPEEEKGSDREPLKVGDTVFVEPFKSSGRVLSVTKNSVRVEVGRIRCEVPVSAVKKSQPEPEAPGAESRTPEPTAAFELNILGFSRDDALQALDIHIDRAFMSGLPVIRIVHGKGRGILKEAIQEALKRDSRVKSFREGMPEEGGWGVTIAKLST